MRDPDLRILALADAKLLPMEIQDPFDRWRIWRARDAVAIAVRRRLLNVPPAKLPMIQMYLERLEEADEEGTIFEGIYAIAEVVEVHRQALGLHSEYIVLIMAGQLNPWGLLDFQRDFENPASSIVDAARELWRLAQENNVDIDDLLSKIRNDETFDALEAYYAAENVAN
jgi:hypothetical protein